MDNIDHTPKQQHTLLYVEDNLANVALVRQLLARRNDFNFLTARNGDLGMIMARTHEPAVILMDINLPGMSGYDVMELLRNDPITCDIPVIALSSRAHLREIVKGGEAGFFRYLTKPYKLNDLLEALDSALDFISAKMNSMTLTGT